ncbi:MAG: hypothetical protein ABL904_24080, partial [Hyphomicrobiaceae bacterium]
MNAVLVVDHLRDTDVGGERAQHIGVLPRQASAIDNKVKHAAHSDARGHAEIRIERHCDHVRWRFSKRPLKPRVTMQRQPETPRQRCFDCRNAYFGHKRQVLDHICALAGEAGVREPDQLTHEIALLMDGAIVAAMITKDPGVSDIAHHALRK